MAYSDNFTAIIDELSKMPLEEQEMVLEILHKRIIEKRREEIAKNAKKSIDEYKKGLVSKGNASKLMRELDNG